MNTIFFEQSCPVNRNFKFQTLEANKKNPIFFTHKINKSMSCTSKLPNIILKTLTELPASIQYSRANSREIDKDTKNTIDKRNEI